MTFIKAIGLTVMLHRKETKLSQRKLAALAGLHPMALSKIERGIHDDIGVMTLSRICDALTDAHRENDEGDDPEVVSLAGLLIAASELHEHFYLTRHTQET